MASTAWRKRLSFLVCHELQPVDADLVDVVLGRLDDAVILAESAFGAAEEPTRIADRGIVRRACTAGARL
jgi:hypothetical protein